MKTFACSTHTLILQHIFINFQPKFQGHIWRLDNVYVRFYSQKSPNLFTIVFPKSPLHQNSSRGFMQMTKFTPRGSTGSHVSHYVI